MSAERDHSYNSTCDSTGEKLMVINAFIVCGTVCLLAQIIYNETRLTAGHITTLFVILGALLESFHLYDRLIEFGGIGATLPIMSFGHSLAHASYASAVNYGWLGLISGMFDKTSSGIVFAIFMAFTISILFKPKS